MVDPPLMIESARSHGQARMLIGCCLVLNCNPMPWPFQLFRAGLETRLHPDGGAADVVQQSLSVGRAIACAISRHSRPPRPNCGR